MRNILFLLFLIGLIGQSSAQSVFWFEDFDYDAHPETRWQTENAPGSMTNPTPAGIPGLAYGINAAIEHDYFIINDRNTPELDGPITTGVLINAEGQFVRGRHYDCSAPNDLPNPFINTTAPPSGNDANQSLHITAFPACATLLYGGTASSDDWNCIAISGNDSPLTQSEQTAWLNTDIDATGKCNLKLTADFFLGGDAQGVKDHSTILYSTDGGTSWKILQDNLASCSFFYAGTCNAWFRMSFDFPSDADNISNLRIAFRWVEDGNLNNMTDDYALGASFNVDNIMISACDIPDADFTADNLTVCKNETVTFTSSVVSTSGLYLNCFTTLSDDCTPTSYSWNITGPGTVTYVNSTSATDPNPQVQFDAVGNYTAVLTVTNCAGNTVVNKPNYITVNACPPSADFNASQVIACVSPSAELDTITFTDLSTSVPGPITSWTWSFSPATVTYVNATNANSQNPDVVFNAAGLYQVTLTVTNVDGSDAEVKTAYINAITCDCGTAVAPGVFWTEDFENGCASGCSANGYNGGNGAWVNNTTIGPNSANANTWFVSNAENGNPAGSCGSAGLGDESLHLGSTAFMFDPGAAYYAGGIGDPTTNIRAESPTIDCSGRNTISVDFVYMENGEGSNDNATMWYFDGSSWSPLFDPPKTSTACSPQGKWTAVNISLPASADNNSNIKIGFNWTNNSSAGSDPSFAVDDITLTGTGAAPINTWEGDVSSDWAVAGNWLTGVVPTSATDCQVPSTLGIGCVWPEILSPAAAKSVCNYGTITLRSDNTLTIEEDLLNDGIIQTTTTNNVADVIFANSASVYRGNGTMYDVDVRVTSSDLTLETDMIARSLIIATTGTVDIGTNTLYINKNLTKTAGTFTAVNGIIFLNDACTTCVDATSTADISINANQIFGDMFVKKPASTITSLISAFDYTFNTPKTLTIYDGIVDANANTLNGTGNMTMTDGELRLAKNSTDLPELTGTYILSGGRITLDGGAQIIKSEPDLGTDYFDLEFAGTGIKTFSGGNVHVANQLYLSLPTGVGNYVNTGVDTLKVNNNDPNAIVRTGGHIVGYLSRSILIDNNYVYYVGSTNADLETYYEPLTLSPQNLINISDVTCHFNDAAPNPGTVSVPFVNGLGNADTIQTMEMEGYWQLNSNQTVGVAKYDVMVAPDRNFWTFGVPFGTGHHALLKQSTTGIAWDFIVGGVRANDSLTTNFTGFSNFALGFADSILPVLPVELLSFDGYCNDGDIQLLWVTASETNNENYIIEKSTNGSNFYVLEEVPSNGNSNEIQRYELFDRIDNPESGTYYRLSQRDIDGEVNKLHTIFVSCDNSKPEFRINVYPNPAKNVIYMDIYSDRNGIGVLNVVDIFGKIVYSNENISINQGLNFNAYEFPAELSDGIYFIATTFENETTNTKLIIIK